MRPSQKAALGSAQSAEIKFRIFYLRICFPVDIQHCLIILQGNFCVLPCIRIEKYTGFCCHGLFCLLVRYVQGKLVGAFTGNIEKILIHITELEQPCSVCLFAV